MASDDFGEPGSDSAERFEFVIGLAVRNAIATDDPDGFLDWFARFFTLGDYFPKLLERMGAAQAMRSMAAVLGRIIWNRTPRPDNHFRPHPRKEYRELWVQSGALTWATGLDLVAPRKAR